MQRTKSPAFPKVTLPGAAALALSELVRQRGTAKVQEGSAPSHSPAGERQLHLGKEVCRL